MTSGTGVSVSFFGGIPGISGGIFGPGVTGGVTEGVHPPQPESIFTITRGLLRTVVETHSFAVAESVVEILAPIGPVAILSKSKTSVAPGGSAGIVKVIVFDISSTNAPRTFTNVPVWKRRLPET